MRLLTTSTLSCAFLSLAGVPALAQQDGGMSGIQPEALTCADIMTMNPEMVPGALYFVAGYMHGSDAGTAADAMPEAAADPSATGTAPAATDAAPAATDADPAAMDSAPAADSADATTDTATAPDMAETEADPATDGTDAATDTDSATDTTAAAPETTGTAPATGTDPAAPASEMATSDAAMAMVDGMFVIPLESMVTLCTQSPEMTVADALAQHRGGTGMTTN